MKKAILAFALLLVTSASFAGQLTLLGVGSPTGGGPPPTTWTPTNLNTQCSCVVAWWDAQDSPHIALSGSNVTSWTDKVGGIVASQATSASQPTWSATARNGKPGVTSSSSQVLTFSPAALPSGTATVSIALAAFSTSNGITAVFFSYGGFNSDPNKNIFSDSATNGTNVSDNGTISPQLLPWLNLDNFIVWQATSTNWSVTVNGGTPNTMTVGSTSVPLTGGAIFAWPDGSFAEAAGTIQQIVLMNSTLDTNQRQCLEGWESWYDGKAGSNLPGGHPYISAAPTTASNCS